MVDHHAGLAVGDFLHLLHHRHVHGDVLPAPGFGVVGGQLRRLRNGVVRGRSAAAGDDDVGAMHLGGMAPDVVLPGKAEGQLVVLAVVPADVDRIAVGAFKPHGRQLGLLHALPVGVRTEIPALL